MEYVRTQFWWALNAVLPLWWVNRVTRWENRWNHPEHKPWPNYPDSRWGPRCAWLCALCDWVTAYECHD